MLEPWKNPRSNVWWFRRRVPAIYRKFGMPAEIKFSLETKDWHEAVARCSVENLKLERQWRATLVGAKPDELTHVQIVALAGEFYAEMVATHRDEPGREIEWQMSLQKIARRKKVFIGSLGTHLRLSFGDEARAFLQKRGILLVGERFEKFVKAYVEAKETASRALMDAAKFNFDKVDNAPYYPKFEKETIKAPFVELWTEFCKLKGIAPATRKKWEPCLRKLFARARTTDATAIKQQDIVEWRDALLATIPSPVTVRDGYLAAAKSFFGWAKGMNRIPTDPTDGVNVMIGGKVGKKMRGFTDEEAAVILAAALAPMSPLMSRENAAARKWVPWICAYTGARVNEITQLRRGDVQEIRGIPCLRISPEAGTVKTDEPRTVPLHPHLLQMGFMEFVSGYQSDRPLFYSTARQRKADRKNPTYASVGNKLAEWVRDLGIKDRTVAPNHGWRHRFKREGLRAQMIDWVLDVIQGHAPRTEGQKYDGELEPEVSLPEIVKYPWYDVSPAAQRDRRRKAEAA